MCSRSWSMSLISSLMMLATALSLPACEPGDDGGTRPSAARSAAASQAQHQTNEGLPFPIHAYVWHDPTANLAIPRGVTRLHLLAGEIAFVEGRGIQRINAPAWTHLPDDRVLTLVYRVRQRLIRRFEDSPNGIRDAILAAYVEDRARLRSAGRDCAGVQIDFDCPTRLLDAYAAFLEQLDREVDKPITITTLPTWLGSASFEAVARACDGLIAQMYAMTLPTDDEDTPALTSLADIDRWLDGYADLETATGTPYTVALPTYGHVLIFGPGGERLSIAGDLGPTEAYSKSDLKPAAPPMNDELHTQHRFHGPAGRSLRIVHVHAAGLAKMLRCVAERPRVGCEAIALFRLGEPGAELTLGGESIEAALADAFDSPGPAIEALVHAELADRPDGRGLRLDIRNDGTAGWPNVANPNPVRLRVDPPARIWTHQPTGEPYRVVRYRDGSEVDPSALCDRIAVEVPYLGPGRVIAVPVIRALAPESASIILDDPSVTASSD